MHAQSVYMFRRTSGVYLWPEHRKDFDDRLFDTQVCMLGGHQLMVDLSRCNQVSATKFYRLKQCESLNFLDLSYTKCNSIREIAEGCQNLRSLMLAGLSMSTDAYQQLSKLTTLEVLSLRNSKNITDRVIKPCKDMLMLRSLDLGHTDVQTITPLAGLSRLEELCLDHTGKLYSNQGEEGAAEALKVLQTLPSLRVLNISESASLWDNRAALALQLSPELYIEPRTRRILFLEAIMNKDAATVRRFVADGIDINMQLGPWANDILREYWLKRCNAKTSTKTLKTPFFLCTHHTEKYRPTPLALAVMWNAQETIADFLFMGATTFMQVWFGEVLDYGGKIVVDEDAMEAIAKQDEGKNTKSLVVYYLQQLPQAMFDRNVHRLTDGHVEKKTTNWKEITRFGLSDIDRILKGDFAKVRIDQKVRNDNWAAEAALVKAAAAKKTAELEKMREDADKAEQEEERRRELEEKAAEDLKANGGKKVVKKMDAAQLARKQKKEESEALEAQMIKDAAERRRIAAIIPGDKDVQRLWEEEERADRLKEHEEQDAIEAKAAAIADSHARMEVKVIEDFIIFDDFKTLMREIADESIADETPIPYKKPGRQPLKMLKEKPTPYDWRQHGMVVKLMQETPIKIGAEVSGRDKDVFFLGKRSYWNESNAFTLDRRLAFEQKQRDAHETRRREDRIYEMNVQRLARQRGWKLDKKPSKSLAEKKEYFKEKIAYTFHRRFLVRGEDEPDEEEEEQEEEETEADPADFSFGGDSPTPGGSFSPTPSPSRGGTPLLGQSPVGSLSPVAGVSLSNSRVGSKPPSPRIDVNHEGEGPGPAGMLVFKRTTSVVPEDDETKAEVENKLLPSGLMEKAPAPAPASARCDDPNSPETQSEPVSPQPSK